ncbi:MAG: PGPGW domain-containing protein [Desulfobulbaceae bacterium]|nr:PGPGW domain-containing protein [Desulfobulbaceae bacterium]
MNFSWASTLGRAKRLIRIVIGTTILIVGVFMIVLPGPAVVVIPVGLMILATEFVWARKLMERFEKRVKSIKNKGVKTDET